MRNSRYWMSQRTWFIDDSASVENTGATSGSPVPAAERRRRMGPNPIWENGDYHIRYLATTPADAIEGECAGANTVIYCHAGAADRVGVSPVAHTSSALDVLNTATNTPFAVTAGTLTAAGAVNKRIRWTSGAAVNAHAWGTLAVSTNKLRLTEVLIPVASFAAAPFAIPAATVAAPANGDTFVVEDLRVITRLHIGLRAPPAGSSLGIRVVLDSISTTLSGGADCAVFSDGSNVTTLAGEIRSHTMRGCQLNILIDTGRKIIQGGHHVGNFYMSANMAFGDSVLDHFTLQGDHFIGLTSGTGVGASSNWLIGQIGMFDATSVNSSGIYIAANCQFRASLPTVIYGNTAGQPFVFSQLGALIVRGSTPVTPIVFSAPAPFGITTGGTVSRYEVPAYDPDSRAWTEPRLMSFANLLAAVTSGGFGGLMNDPYTGARMVG